MGALSSPQEPTWFLVGHSASGASAKRLSDITIGLKKTFVFISGRWPNNVRVSVKMAVHIHARTTAHASLWRKQ